MRPREADVDAVHDVLAKVGREERLRVLVHAQAAQRRRARQRQQLQRVPLRREHLQPAMNRPENQAAVMRCVVGKRPEELGMITVGASVSLADVSEPRVSAAERLHALKELSRYNVDVVVPHADKIAATLVDLETGVHRTDECRNVQRKAVGLLSNLVPSQRRS